MRPIRPIAWRKHADAAKQKRDLEALPQRWIEWCAKCRFRESGVRQDDGTFAQRAQQHGALFPAQTNVSTGESKNGFSPLVEAGLTDVVRRLRTAWLIGPAQLWDEVYPICKVPLGDLDKRVAVELRDGFLQFSQLLAGFEILRLELEHGGVVREQSVLGLEQLFVQGRHTFGDEVEVADPDHGLGHVAGDTERGGDDADF
jgi:hypothetical protein